jgi:hypothetical protein
MHTGWLVILRQGHFVFQCAFILKMQSAVVRFVSSTQLQISCRGIYQRGMENAVLKTSIVFM